MASRRAVGSDTLTRAPARTLDWTPEGKPLQLDPLLPQQGGPTKERWVRVGEQHRHLMRLFILRVPEEVAEHRRADLEADAKRRGQPVRERAWKLAAWTILLTDAPEHLLSLQEALVLVRGRWQREMRSTLWKHDGRLDEWRTTNAWRVLCERYARLIGWVFPHWLITLFARAAMSSAVWSHWRRSSARAPVLCWKLSQGIARFSLRSTPSNVACVQDVK